MFRTDNMIWRKGIVCKASSIASPQARWYIERMLTKYYSAPRGFSWIENYKLIWLALVTWCCYFTTQGILEKTWNHGSVSPNNWFSQCSSQWIRELIMHRWIILFAAAFSLEIIRNFLKTVILEFCDSPTQILVVFLSRKTVGRATRTKNFLDGCLRYLYTYV